MTVIEPVNFIHIKSHGRPTAKVQLICKAELGGTFPDEAWFPMSGYTEETAAENGARKISILWFGASW
jgi:hypothetical protein